MLSDRRSRFPPSALRSAALALGLCAAAITLVAAQRDAREEPAKAATGQVKLYRAHGERRGVVTFKLAGLHDFTIRRGELRLGDARQAVSVAALRAGARRHTLRVRLSQELRAARRRGARTRALPTLAVSIAGPLVPARGVLFGAYHRPANARWSVSGLAAFERTIGRRLDVDHHYHAWGTDYWPSSHAEGEDVAKGRVPMLSLGGSSQFPGLDAINNGSQDAFLRAAARRIRRFRSQLFLRPLWEMNGDWSAWGGPHGNDPGQTNGPSKYVAAWRRMHEIFAAERATNAVWVWVPHCKDAPKAAWNHWSNYYPGDAYVDWVGCDGYNRGDTERWSTWRSFAAIFGATPSVYRDYLRKPFMVAETGSCEHGGSKARWIDDARLAIKSSFPNVKALIWFDVSKECDWRVSSSSSSLSAFRAMGADAYFNP